MGLLVKYINCWPHGLRGLFKIISLWELYVAMATVPKQSAQNPYAAFAPNY